MFFVFTNAGGLELSLEQNCPIFLLELQKNNESFQTFIIGPNLLTINFGKNFRKL